MGLHSCSLRTQADCPPRKAGQDQTAAHSHGYTGETPDASEAMSTLTQVLHVHFGLLYMRTVLQSLKTELLENFLRGEDIQNRFVFGKTQTDVNTTEKSHTVTLANRRFQAYNYRPIAPKVSTFKKHPCMCGLGRN